MWGHGPDAQTFEKASGTVVPGAHRMPDDSLAFMFETSYQCRLTEYSSAVHAPDPQLLEVLGAAAATFQYQRRAGGREEETTGQERRRGERSAAAAAAAEVVDSA